MTVPENLFRPWVHLACDTGLDALTVLRVFVIRGTVFRWAGLICVAEKFSKEPVPIDGNRPLTAELVATGQKRLRWRRFWTFIP